MHEDADLTRVGRGTPGGEYLRRFWQPIAYADDVTDLPLKLRILGEDLVLFRTAAATSAWSSNAARHRGASLEYGVISNDGIRCAYHGFHYAPDGTILSTGSGAPMSNAGKLCLGAYPLFIYHTLIFAYMGPSETKPPFPMLDLYENPHVAGRARPRPRVAFEVQLAPDARKRDGPDAHGVPPRDRQRTTRGFSDQMGVIPVLQWMQAEHGMYYVASRRVGDLVWIRVVDSFMPNFGLIPPTDRSAERSRYDRNSRGSHPGSFRSTITTSNACICCSTTGASRCGPISISAHRYGSGRTRRPSGTRAITK